MSEALPSPQPIYQPQVQDGPPVMGAAPGPLPPSSAPAGELPEDGVGKPVFLTFEQLADVLARLRELLPADARFSFNHDSEKAWIVAGNGVDLHPIVEQALGELGQTMVSPDQNGATGHSVV